MARRKREKIVKPTSLLAPGEVSVEIPGQDIALGGQAGVVSPLIAPAVQAGVTAPTVARPATTGAPSVTRPSPVGLSPAQLAFAEKTRVGGQVGSIEARARRVEAAGAPARAAVTEAKKTADIEAARKQELAVTQARFGAPAEAKVRAATIKAAGDAAQERIKQAGGLEVAKTTAQGRTDVAQMSIAAKSADLEKQGKFVGTSEYNVALADGLKTIRAEAQAEGNAEALAEVRKEQITLTAGIMRDLAEGKITDPGSARQAIESIRESVAELEQEIGGTAVAETPTAQPAQDLNQDGVIDQRDNEIQQINSTLLAGERAGARLTPQQITILQDRLKVLRTIKPTEQMQT